MLHMGTPAAGYFGEGQPANKEHEGLQNDPFSGDNLTVPDGSRKCVDCGKAYKAKGTDYCIGHLTKRQREGRL